MRQYLFLVLSPCLTSSHKTRHGNFQKPWSSVSIVFLEKTRSGYSGNNFCLQVLYNRFSLLKKHILCLVLFFLIPAISCKGQVPTGSPFVLLSRPISKNDNVHCSLQDRSGKLWFGTTGFGVYCYDGTSFTNYTTKNGLNDDHVWAMFEDKQGNLLFGTNAGVCRYDGKTFTNITMNSGLNTSSVWSFYEDRAGSIWIGTGDSSVFQYDGQHFNTFLNPRMINTANIRLNYIQKMLEDKAGNIWFASWNGEGLCYYDGKALTNFVYDAQVSENMVHTIFEDKKGHLWIGTRNYGVYRYDGKSISHFREQDGLVSRGIACILEDKKGNIWFGTATGVFCYDGKSFTHFTKNDGLFENSVFSIVEDKTGKLWFGTKGIGLTCYDGHSFINFSDKLR